MQPRETCVPLLVAPGPWAATSHEQEMGEDEQRYLATGEASSSKNCKKQQPLPLRSKQQQKFKRHKSNRLLPANGGSRLIENFSEFLASRNVINRCSRYDKIVDDEREPHVKRNHLDRQLEQQQPHRQPIFRCDQLKASSRHHHHNGTLRGYFYNNSGVSQPEVSSGKQSRLYLLIGALFSRNQRSKLTVLVKLLRLPVVLAALFSLLLVATLLTLYTMSFHHQHHLAHITYHPGGGGSSIEQDQTQAGHHINSRHLKGPPTRASGTGTGSGNSVSPNAVAGMASERDVDSDDDVDLDERVDPEYGARRGQFFIDGRSQASFDRALTVQTECGAFVGRPEDSAIVFSGIPYASPPVGGRRWTRPRPVWLDERLCQRNRTSLALERRSHCAQLSPVTRRFTGHEDCLYMDIFAPKLDQVQLQKLPVMVYIHGGFLAYGSSGQGRVNWMKAQPGGRLVAELNVVLVAVNYRLQALGFMTLLQLAQNNGPDGSEGNYGLWDQLVALNWIKRNIESFGGDPDNIVLFGPDSASALPLALLTGRRREATRSATEPPAADQGPTRARAAATTSATTWIRNSRDLFRAVWLTNPTVYYELPYELANGHYQRLFLDSSPCQEPDNNNNRTPNGLNDNDNNIGATTSRPRAGSGRPNQRAQGETRWARELGGRQQSAERTLLECLMNLTAEQVVRHYLGQDDPSYRLDDQNSLPIHGVYADQFVTIDRELVQDSYPFGARGGGEDQKWQPQSGNEKQQSPALAAPTSAPAKGALVNLNQSPAAVRKAPSGANLGLANETSTLDANSGPSSSGYNDDYDDDNCVGPICAQGGKDLLLGSTAQAVEYWLCPRDLHQWTWEDFRRYVNISLNSFVSDTYKRASELYAVPGQQMGAPSTENSSTGDNSSTTNQNPVETYLTMVSDIRQTCPINELAASLGSRRNRVHRYIVETRPTGNRLTTLSPRATATATDQQLPLTEAQESQPGQQLEPTPSQSSKQLNDNAHSGNNNSQHQHQPRGQHHKQHVPEYAFHTWDLMAFFGFEFEPHYEPSAEDLKFQSQIRAMVRRFVHKEQQQPMGNDDKTTTTISESSPNRRAAKLSSDGGSFTTIFDKEARQIRTNSAHKLDECRMWRQHLGQSYAWVS